LNCDDVHEGCLCFECKCTKCYWYSSPSECDGRHGYCDLKTERENKKISINEAANKLAALNLKANPLVEQRILDLLKVNPDSKVIFITLGCSFTDEEIDRAFDSLILKGLIREKLKKYWNGKEYAYRGEIAHWEVIKCLSK